MGVGSLGGVGISATVGGMGLSFGGSAIGIGTGSMATAGGILGLGIYGLAKMFSSTEIKEAIEATFNHIEEQISDEENYFQALMELDPLLADIPWKQKFDRLEIDEELEVLKAQIKSQQNSKSFFDQEVKEEKKNNYTNNLNIDGDRDNVWQCVKTLFGHQAKINSLDIRNNLILSGGDDGNVCLWDLDTGKKIYTFFGITKEVNTVKISPDGQTIAAAGCDCQITSWYLESKKINSGYYSNPGYLYSHEGLIHDLVYSPDGNNLYSCGADKKIRIWSQQIGILKLTLNGHTDTVTTLAVSPDNKTLISGSADKTIRIWDFSNPWQAQHILTGHSAWITSVSISSDGQYLVSVSRDRTVKLWCLPTKNLLSTFTGHSDIINAVAISPDSKTIASCSQDGTVILWDIITRQHLQTINAFPPICFSPDGKYLIATNSNNQIQAWQKFSSDSALNIINSNNWWEVLKIGKNAPKSQIKIAYYNLAKQYHPDVNNSPDAEKYMRIINTAYQQASNNCLHD